MLSTELTFKFGNTMAKKNQIAYNISIIYVIYPLQVTDAIQKSIVLCLLRRVGVNKGSLSNVVV